MKGQAELVKQLMNGAKIPNWVGLAAWIASMVWMFATSYFGSRATTAATTAAVNVRIDSLVVEVRINRDDAKRRTKEINEELKNIGKRVNYIARGIE